MPELELSVINPGFIMGPCRPTPGFTSGEIIKKMMIGEMPSVPSVHVGCVDVRDVA